MLVLSNDSDYFKIFGEEKYGIDALIPELHSRNNVIVGKVVIIDELMIYFQKNIFEKINPICESLSMLQLRKLTSVSSFVQGVFFSILFIFIFWKFYFIFFLGNEYLSNKTNLKLKKVISSNFKDSSYLELDRLALAKIIVIFF